jgi:hypothetical protein
LQQLLRDLRKTKEAEIGRPLRLGIPGLDDIWARHGGRLEITGPEGLELLYQIVSIAVSPPRNGTIVVVDVDGRFDVTQLRCEIEDLKHVHVYRPLKGHVKDTILQVEDYLLGREHASMGRECVGIVVNGAQGGDVMVGWKGWLKVESGRDDVPRFGMGISVEEAMREREQRQLAIETKGWRAVSDWGEYRWTDE